MQYEIVFKIDRMFMLYNKTAHITELKLFYALQRSRERENHLKQR
jgi:hypothetical protein